MQGEAGLEQKPNSGLGAQRRRRSSRSRAMRRMHHRQGRQRRARKVLFYMVLVGASVAMGYIVSRHEPSVAQHE